jgi:non-specific serine/threonine protein kinase
MIGETVSHYKILEKIGEGGMGVVYKAEDTRLKRTVALKFLPAEMTRDAQAKERFVQEAQAASALDHPNICTIHQIDETDDGRTFICMTCYDGETLEERIATGPLSVEEAAGIAAQIAAGLAKAHAQGIVHRDVKPANVFLTGDGQVKIFDFGLAKLAGLSRLTRDGTAVGTAAYMSPEQTSGEDVDHRTDIWALGAVLYEMISGKLPFDGAHEPALIYSIMNKDPEPLSDRDGDTPEAVAAIAGKCLAKSPEDRYPNAGELASELRQRTKTSTDIPLFDPHGMSGARSKRPTTLRMLGLALVLILALAGAYFVYSRLSALGGGADEDGRTMLVVLPFENLGPPENDYFADGVTEEITSRLAASSGLGVISRTSAFQYKAANKSIKEIGEELRVDYVLEGTVRWDHPEDGDSRVRVTPQLIRVADDTHVWTDQYDGVLSDIFAVQTEIATQVIDQLNVTLLEPERRALDARPTADMEAYQAYLRGLDYAARPGYSIENFRLAISMFGRAVELDPDFALAWADLSRAHSTVFNAGVERTEEHVLKTKAAADRALELQSELPEAQLALGYYYYHCLRDYEKALEQFDIAAEHLPNQNEILQHTGWIRRRQSRWDEALDHLKRSLELNPRDPNLMFEIGISCLWMRRYEEAETYYDRSIALAPDEVWGYAFKALNYWLRSGDIEAARAVLERMPDNDEPTAQYFWFLQEVFEGKYQAALDRLASLSVEIIETPVASTPKASLAGLVYELTGDTELERAAYETAVELLEREVEVRSSDGRVHSALGLAYAELGLRDEAIREAKLAVELIPVSEDALRGSKQIDFLAQTYRALGEYDAAFDQLEYELSIPAMISVESLRIDPWWAPLRDHPRFRAILGLSEDL